MADSYRNKAMSGLSWTVAQQVGQQVIQFVIQMVLARLLMPEEFGLVAMMSVFLVISNMIAQAGMESAIVQAEKLSDVDIRTAFTLNVLMGVLMTLTLCFIAPWISIFYKEPEMVVLLRVLAISVLFQQLGGIHRALLSRNLNYRDLMLASLPALLISGLLGLTSALVGLGVWALVTQSITYSIISSCLLWGRSEWSVKFGFSVASFMRLFPYGWKIAVNQILNSFFNQLYILVIGKFYATSEVAFYQRAKSFQNLAVINLMSVFNRVAFPLLSRLNADDELRMKEAHYKFLTAVSWVVLPTLAALASLGEPMVLFLLTDKWINTVPYLKILCYIGMILAINVANANFMLAKGDAGLHLKLSIVSKILVVAVLFLTFKKSIFIMLWGHLLTTIVVNALLLYFINTRYDISLKKIYILLQGPVFTAIFIYYVGQICLSALMLNAFFKLCIGGLLSAVVYWCGLLIYKSRFKKDFIALKNTHPKIFKLVNILKLV